MTWELREVDEIECTMDDSGVYVVISRVVDSLTRMNPVGRVRVRADLITSQDEPIVSFIGSANNVRKHLIRFLTWTEERRQVWPISLEHTSYIGYELLRAETDPQYVQD